MLRFVILIAAAGCGRFGFEAVSTDDGGSDDTLGDSIRSDVVPIGHDEDGDGVRDVDDTCPHLAGPQTDGDGDRVGDICDPNPAVGGELIKLFATMGPGDQPFVISSTSEPGWSQEEDSLRFAGSPTAPVFAGVNMPFFAANVRVAVGLDVDAVLPVSAGMQNQIALAVVDQDPLYFVELLDVEGALQRAQITLFDGAIYSAMAMQDLATGIHTGSLFMQTTQIFGTGVVFHAEWPGEPYDVGVQDAVYQGTTRIELNVNNVHFEIRYLIVIGSP